MNESSSVIEIRGWGLRPTPGARYHWSARALFTRGTVDLVWDRMGIEGEASVEERAALTHWLNVKALPLLNALCKGVNAPRPHEDREVTVCGDGYRLRANPRASHGYLYLSAAVDKTATGPTPNVPRRAK